MQIRKLRWLFLIIFLSEISPLYAQTVFEIEFRFPEKHTQTGKALVVYQPDGGGYVRIAWYDAIRRKKVITDLDLIPSCQITFPDGGMLQPLAAHQTFIFCRAVPVKYAQGKSPFPADDFTFWLIDDGTGIRPYDGDLPEFNNPRFYNDLYAGKVAYSPVFTMYNYIPAFYGFTDSTNIVAQRILSARELTHKLLIDYFDASDLLCRFPISISRLTAIRNKNTATLFLITMTNLSDNSIRKTTEIDKISITDFFGKAARAIHLKLKRIRLEQGSFTKASLESTIHSLRIKKNDVVIFAYSGHGFSYTNDPKYQYPQLALWSGKQDSTFFRTQSINLETVFDYIKGKGARLNIVIGDCCNADALLTRHITKVRLSGQGAQSGGVTPALRRNYFRLLVETEGSYIACAAKKGEMSAGTSSAGGFFTSAFVTCLNDEMKSPADIDPQSVWKDIFINTQTMAATRAAKTTCRGVNRPCRQTMVFNKAVSAQYIAPKAPAFRKARR